MHSVIERYYDTEETYSIVKRLPLCIGTRIRVSAAMSDNVDRLIDGALVWNVRRDLIDIRSCSHNRLA
jgi:hypothetical protein